MKIKVFSKPPKIFLVPFSAHSWVKHSLFSKGLFFMENFLKQFITRNRTFFKTKANHVNHHKLTYVARENKSQLVLPVLIAGNQRSFGNDLAKKTTLVIFLCI